MRARLPHKVKIGPTVFKISYLPKILLDGEELSGHCNAAVSEISISLDDNTTKRQILSTLFHEYIHGILYVSGQASILGLLDENGDFKGGHHEEGLVLALESFMYREVNWKSPIWKDWSLEELAA